MFGSGPNPFPGRRFWSKEPARGAEPPAPAEGRANCAPFFCAPDAEAMPKRTDISSILIIGAGPIVIGQACEFDYSGTQACKALKAEGYRVVLVNSNPATIMTDPDLADATYIEPITPEIVAKIIEKERPDALACRPWAGRPRSTRALSLRTHGRAGQIRRHHDRRHRRRHRQGRGPQAVPRGDDQDRARDAALASDQDADRGAAKRSTISACPPSSGRPSRSAAPAAASPTTRRSSSRSSSAASTPRRPRSADRGIGARLERVRDGGGARQERQLHHRLLDREHRSDGRAYRRFDHRGAGADADRQGIPDHARRLDRGAARDRGRDRRLQRAVRASIRPTAASSSSR